MTESAVAHEMEQEPEQEVAEQQIAEVDALEQETSQETQQQVPLAAVLKERRKRQDAEHEARWYKEQLEKKSAQPAPPEEDDSRYEAATKEDLRVQTQALKRQVKEDLWIESNPEKAEFVNEKLVEFLKQRPHLKLAIEAAPNRYEEAWELMDKLTPKQKAALKPAVTAKKEAPGSPGAVPKAAAMNEAMDVMSMSDKEFAEWRAAKRRKR
jgi:hypothetical protein